VIPTQRELYVVHLLLTCKMKVHFCIVDIIEYNIYNHNTAFLVAQKQEILQEIAAMVEENKRKEKNYYNLQYGLLDLKDDRIPDNGIGEFLMDLNEMEQHVQQDWRKYNARTQHYERLYQPDDHIVEYKKLDEAKEQQHKKPDCATDKDDSKRKAL
jgi:hypothetical protein